jgi:hypothetical protein
MDRFFSEGSQNWFQLQDLPNRVFICGFCSTSVSSIRGFKIGQQVTGGGPQIAGIYICPNCGGPIFIDRKRQQHPSPAIGNSVRHVPETLEKLYEEARRCTSQNCFTAAVLLCRKMLAHIAVEKKAKEGQTFMEYVKFLSEKGFIPPDGKHWVDHIRKKGNEATHEIVLMNANDARELLIFVEMLLRFVYEFPSMIPTQPVPQ